MPKKHPPKNNSTKENPKLGKTILNDLRRGDNIRTIKQELNDLYQFYIDQKSKKQLSEMGRIRRWLKVTWWILKSMFFKLTPVRRIMLLLGIILSIAAANNQNSNFNIGLILLVLVLMLELKDKLLARDELMIGRAVQTALMPENNPDIPNWDVWLYTHPANEVGGDLVDYMKLRENQWGMVLADVAGKGLGAALLTAKLQATLRAIAHNFKSLAKLGAELNKIFCRDGLPNRFVSLLYLEITTESGTVNFLNAGHLPPLLISDGKIIEMPHGDVALGIQSSSVYNDQRIVLKPNDLIVVYSDGVTEAQNENKDFFGEQRLIKLVEKNNNLSASEIGTSLLTAVERFVGDARPSDDLSVVILKRKD